MEHTWSGKTECSQFSGTGSNIKTEHHPDLSELEQVGFLDVATKQEGDFYRGHPTDPMLGGFGTTELVVIPARPERPWDLIGKNREQHTHMSAFV
jgi:hypothetical protein